MADLMAAAARGQRAVVEQLLADDADPNMNMVNANGATALYMAAQNGHLAAAAVLLAADADPNLTRADGRSPLFIASQYGHVDTMQALLAANADPNPADNGATALYMAAQDGNLATATVLLGVDVDPDRATDGNGVAALYVAARDGRVEILRALLGADADPNQCGPDTALFGASQRGRDAAVAVLLGAGANPNLTQRSDGHTPLSIASERRHLATMRALLAAGADPDTRKTPPGAARSNDGLATPLIYAAECNVLPVVQLLLESDAQVNLCRADGCAAIYFAAQNGHITVLETLIAANADINQMASDGTTPLHAAAMWGETAAANVLLAAGATTTAAPVPPLLVACAHGYPNVVRSLLAADADVTARMDGSDQHLMGNGGNTALMLAVGAPEHSLLIVQMLQCYGADPTAVNGGGETAETIAQWGEEPNAVVLEWLRAVDGYTAVEVCARVGDHRQMRALLRAGGNFGPRLALFSGLCPLTAALCRDARKPWSPKHHLLHPPATRAAITMLLHVEVWYKHNIRCPAWATKTWLPRECWLIVMSYFRR